MTAISQPSPDAYASLQCAAGSVPEATQVEVVPIQLMATILYVQVIANNNIFCCCSGILHRQTVVHSSMHHFNKWYDCLINQKDLLAAWQSMQVAGG